MLLTDSVTFPHQTKSNLKYLQKLYHEITYQLSQVITNNCSITAEVEQPQGIDDNSKW